MNLVLKSDRHMTWPRTHLVSESLFGAKLALAVQAASAWATPEAGGTGPQAGTPPRPGPAGPGTREEGQLAPWKGAGAGNP